MIKNIEFKSVIKFTIPSIIAMVFMGLYTMVDGIFVSNFIGSNALSAINIAFPAIGAFIAIGTMFGTGGNAVCATLLGEGNSKEAKEKLTLFVSTAFFFGLIILIVVTTNISDILYFLGANDETFQYAYDYLFIIALFAPFSIAQIILENAMIASGRPELSLMTILAGGATNIVLDYVFLKMGFGMTGIGIATGLGYVVPCFIGIIFFSTNKEKKSLHFVRFKKDIKAVLKAMSNGSSEMVAMLSSSVITYLFNIITLKLAGNAGVSAITVVLYSQLLLASLFIGYTAGISPVISFNYGEKNKINLRKLFVLNMKFVFVASLILTAFAFVFGDIIVSAFLEEGTESYIYAVDGLTIFSFAFLFLGFNVFASGMFTAYSNGKISAFISFLRTFFFITISLLILPSFIGMTGVWLSVPLAEILSFFVALLFINKSKDVYMYGKDESIISRKCVLFNSKTLS